MRNFTDDGDMNKIKDTPCPPGEQAKKQPQKNDVIGAFPVGVVSQS